MLPLTMIRRLAPRLLVLSLFASPLRAEPLKECPDCPELTVIPAGSFQMGSPPGEIGRYDNEGPRHSVHIAAFALATIPVTVAEFAAFVKQTGAEMGACDWPEGASWQSSGIVQSDRQPVVCVSWKDAQAYVAWLNGKVGHGSPYRLPSEAEWEYAARAGTNSARWWGEEIGQGKANCNGCASPWDNAQIAPAGSFGPNLFGLYDMLGNVWQWTEDCWNDSYQNAPADGRARKDGDCSFHVMRGGSWSNLPAFIRSAARNRGGAGDRDHDYSAYTGFRVARSIP